MLVVSAAPPVEIGMIPVLFIDIGVEAGLLEAYHVRNHEVSRSRAEGVRPTVTVAQGQLEAQREVNLRQSSEKE